MSFLRTAPLALLLLLAACGNPSNGQPAPAGPPEVSVITVQPEPVTLSTVLPGRTAAYETSEVRPQVNGLITARLFREGDQVSKGQALYRIDSQPYLTQVASARAALARARSSIASSAALRRRYGELVKINAIARQDYDNAIASAQQAQADVAAQQAAVRAAEIDLARTTIRAPISGRIGRADATTGALVTAGQPAALTTIQKLDPIYVDVPQASADLLRLRKQISDGALTRGSGAARVRLRLEDGSIYPIEGVLQFTDVSVDAATGTQTIRAVFANPRALLLPGMYVRSELIEGTQAAAMLVPQQAVTRDDKGQATVLIVGRDGKIQPRILTTTRTVRDKWLVTAGLRAGDRVIMEGASRLRPGTPVKAVAWKAGAAAGTSATSRAR